MPSKIEGELGMKLANEKTMKIDMSSSEAFIDDVTRRFTNSYAYYPEHIGIENIRLSRQKKLEKEKLSIEKHYQKGKQVYPDFKLMMLLRLEA